jgi:hypothetical protein
MWEAVGLILLAIFILVPLVTLAIRAAWWAFRMVFWLCIIAISIAGAACAARLGARCISHRKTRHTFRRGGFALERHYSAVAFRVRLRGLGASSIPAALSCKIS